MSQDEIGKVLKENYPKWMTYKEVSVIIKVAPQNANKCLRKMVKRDELEVLMVKDNRNRFRSLFRIKVEDQ